MKLVIYGEPRSKQSVRIGKDRNGNVRAFQKAEVKKMEQDIKIEILAQLPANFIPFTKGIIVESITYVFPVLKSFSKSKMKDVELGNVIYKTTKPDLTDNLQKALFDAMEGIVFLNDSQICHMKDIKKIYGLRPRTEIILSELNL